MDTSLPAIAAAIADPPARRRVEERLRTVQRLAEETRRQLTPGNLAAAVTPLSAALEELRAARAAAASAEPKESPSATLMLLDEKIAAAQSALAAAAGVAMDALADRETAVPGESLQVSASVWNAGSRPVEVTNVELLSPDALARAGGRDRRARSPTREARGVEVPGRTGAGRVADDPLFPAPAARRERSTTGPTRRPPCGESLSSLRP